MGRAQALLDHAHGFLYRCSLSTNALAVVDRLTRTRGEIIIRALECRAPGSVVNAILNMVESRSADASEYEPYGYANVSGAKPNSLTSLFWDRTIWLIHFVSPKVDTEVCDQV